MKFCITCHHPPVTKGKAILCCDILGSRGTTKINTLVRVKKRECDSHTDWTPKLYQFFGKRKKVSQRATDIFLAAKINKIKLKVTTLNESVELKSRHDNLDSLVICDL